MREDPDFAAYVAARGPTLVRCLALLGVPVPEAEEIAAEAFATVRSDWPELVRLGDLDADLFGTVLRTDPDTTAALLEEAATLPSLPLPYERVLAVVARRRRRQWAVAGGLTAFLGTTALVVTLVNGSAGAPPPDPDGLGRAQVSAADDWAGVVWWADGTLHLADVDVEVGDVRRLVAAGDAAAYVDGGGRLVAVHPDGRRTLMGRPATYSPLVASHSGLVAWIDVADTGVERLAVWDVPEDRRVSRVVVPGRLTSPTGFDGGWLTFRNGTSDWVWNPYGGSPRKTGDGAPRADGDQWTTLVDTVAGTRLEQVGLALRVVRGDTPRRTYLPGVSGSLSADGRLVIVDPVDADEPRLYDARTGERLDTWYPGGWKVLDATFVGDDRVAWLADRDDGHVVMVVCGTPGHPMDCSFPVDLHATGVPLLAKDSTG